MSPLSIQSVSIVGRIFNRAAKINRIATLSLFGVIFAALPSRVNAESEVMQRDPVAEEAVLQSMHHLHSAFDSQDIKAIADCIADEDFLFVYELDADGKPIKLKSKAALIDWLQQTFKNFRQQNASTQARNPVMVARATSTFAIVTEECQLKVILPDGSIQLESLRATAVARKGSDGWKFTHWHMSASAPIRLLSQEEKKVSAK